MDNYSVLNTELELFEYEGINCIKKKFKSNLDLGISNDLINDFLLEYIQAIQTSKINFPKIKKYKIQSDGIIYYCEYKGKNLLQKFSYEDFLKGEVDYIINKIFHIISTSQFNNLSIDPHLKNFTFLNREVYYVDFCPPLIDKYINHRISIESKHVDIIKENFNYFKPENLFYHFCGDLIDAFRNNDVRPMFSKMYKILYLGNFIKDKKIDTFIEKCTIIRNLEDDRISKGLYLF